MTQDIQNMRQTRPQAQTLFDQGVLAECFDYDQVCTACADACWGEHEHLMRLVSRIRLNLDCADICGTIGQVLSRLTQSNPSVMRAQLQACLAACQACGQELEMRAHGMNTQHYAVCAESCRRCE